MIENYLYYGDNLEIMKKLLDEKGSFIDLVYIDPPFNSNRDYNILYKDREKKADLLQKEVFEDTWSNVDYQKNITEIEERALTKVSKYLKFISDTMPISYISYLSMMAIRIYYIRELLKDTGSFYLHCDPTMSHYLKILCDLIFGEENFRNEIVWERSKSGKTTSNKFASDTDVVLFYSISKKNTFNFVYKPLADSTISQYIKDDNDGRGKYCTHPMQKTDSPGPETTYDYVDNNGRVWKCPAKGWRMRQSKIKALENDGRLYFEGETVREKVYWNERQNTGKIANNFWDDIANVRGEESTGYPTQKPKKLLNRIIEASSNEGDMVADFFCGCGTTIDSAIKLKRKFIGCDISTLSLAVIEKRLKERNGFKKDRDFEVDGLPKNLEQARKLAEDDHFKFQEWAIEYLLNGISNSKKTGDGGIDGNLFFRIPTELENRRCVIEVKSGKNLNIDQVRSFIQTCRENDCTGLFLTMGHITAGMKTECYNLGSINKTVYNCDIVSIQDLMEGKRPAILEYNITYRKSKQEPQKL